MTASKNNYVRLLIATSALMLFPGVTGLAQEKRLTARQVIERIQQHVGVEWRKNTVDTFKAGNPDATVTGIAVTMMATLDVVQRAAKAGKNMVITHEPTFYTHQDKVDNLKDTCFRHESFCPPQDILCVGIEDFVLILADQLRWKNLV